MPFIGKTPETGAFRLIDSITTSATDTYALTVLGDHYFPESARNLIVSLNGVTQAPETAYTVSGSHIVFASALTSSDVIDYILVIGDAVDIGTPSDGTVGNAQLKASLDLSGKTLTLANDQISGDVIHGGTISNFASTGIDDNATSTAITIDSGEDVGVKETNPQRSLHVNSAASNVVARFESTDATAVIELKDDSGTAEIGCTGNDVVIAPAGVEKARVTTGGYLGINNSSPSESVSIIGTGGTAKIRFDGDSSNLQNNFIGITGYDDLIIASDESNSGSASTIQFRVDATTRFYMNSAGHTTLIGTGSTNNNNTAEVLSVTGANHVRHMISTSATNGSQASLALESNSATVAIATTGGNEMRFTTNNTERMRILASGGITFNGDTAAANALDDYEEGSWTPQVFYQNSTDQANATNTVQSGRYRKIGSLVYVTFRLDFSQSGSPVNDNIGVKNLPFAGSLNHYEGGGSVITSSSEVGLIWNLPVANSTVAVLVNSANSSNLGNEFGTGSNKYIRGSFTYITS